MAEVDLSDAEKVYIIHGVQVLYLFQLMCFFDFTKYKWHHEMFIFLTVCNRCMVSQI